MPIDAKKMKNVVVVFLDKGGYKLSSYYGKILNNGMLFSTLAAAKQACEDAGYEYLVA